MIANRATSEGSHGRSATASPRHMLVRRIVPTGIPCTTISPCNLFGQCGPSQTCTAGYVRHSCVSNFECNLSGTCDGFCEEGTLGPTPYYKPSSEWGTAKVRGPAIRPGTTYSVYTEGDFPGGKAHSRGATAATWRWGDVDHNNDVNVTWPAPQKLIQRL